MVNSIAWTPSVNPTTGVTTSGATPSPSAGGGGDAGATAAALSQSIYTSNLYPGPLGLGRPLNPEDAGAILAEAELALDETAGQGRRDRIENGFAVAQTALGAFAGRSAAARSAIAQDGAGTAADLKTEGELTQQRDQQQLLGTSASAAAVAAGGAVADLTGRSPPSGASVSRSTYVADLSRARDGLSAATARIADDVTKARDQALTERAASLAGQIAAVDARVAGLGVDGDAAALKRLQDTRGDLADDLKALPATLDQAYGAVLAAATGPLRQSIAALDARIDQASHGAGLTKRYGAGDYEAAAGGVAQGASGLAGQVQASTDALAAVAKDASAVTADLAALAADVAVQQRSVARNAALLIPVFSRIATDTVGNGAGARDRAKSAILSKGFEDLDDATQKFRDAEASQDRADVDRRHGRAESVDAARVSALVAGLLAGLGDLRSVVRQETATSSDRVSDAAALTVGQRFRLAL